MAFDYNAARAAGYSDSEIQAYLSKNTSTTGLNSVDRTLGVGENKFLDFGRGAAKGLGSTISGLGQLGGKLLGAITPKSMRGGQIQGFGEFRTPGNAQLAFAPKTGAERAGFNTEQFAEYFAPMPGTQVAKGTKLFTRLAINAPKEALRFGGITAAQEGTLNKKVGTSALLGAASAPIGEVVSKIGKVLTNKITRVGSLVTGQNPTIVEMAFNNPKLADEAIKNGDKALFDMVNKGAETSSKMRQAFITAHKKAFTKLAGQNANKLVNQSEIKNKFIDLLKENKVLTGIGKQKGVKLNFAISDIKANPGEVSKIKDTLTAINQWNDWTLQGMNELKQLVGKLSKFETVGRVGVTTSKSPTLGRFYNFLDKTIKGKLSPETSKAYSALNQKFEQNIGLMNDMYDAFNSGDPIKRLARVFGKNEIGLRNIIKVYENASGQSVLPTVAGRELAQEGEFALFNPRSWLDTVINPKTQAKMITGAGKIYASRAGKAVGNAIKQTSKVGAFKIGQSVYGQPTEDYPIY